MPRRLRAVIPHQAHHVVQRGNYQQYIFEKDQDFRTYLYLIEDYSKKYDLTINAYCLMNNHVHFVVTPSNKCGLSELFKNANMRYSQYKNSEKRRLGHLWQGRFYSCCICPSYLTRVIRYVEMNPVRAKMVTKPWQYCWSSARQHLQLERFPIIKTNFHELCRQSGLDYKSWKNYLTLVDNEMFREIRRTTQKGLALGDEAVIIKWEKALGIALREPKRGRPNTKKKGE